MLIYSNYELDEKSLKQRCKTPEEEQEKRKDFERYLVVESILEHFKTTNQRPARYMGHYFTYSLMGGILTIDNRPVGFYPLGAIMNIGKNGVNVHWWTGELLSFGNVAVVKK